VGLVAGVSGLCTVTEETVQTRHAKRFALSISFLVKGFGTSALQNGKARAAQADLR